MSVTIRDIAQAASVSPSTVSRALNDHPRISTATRERIKQLAQEMGYTPSALARGLVTRKTATIGVVITTVSDPFLAPLVIGIEEMAHSNGYSVLFSSSHSDAERELDAVRSFYERRASGVVVVGSRVDEAYLKLRDRLALPIVLTNCRTYPYSVASDNLAGAHLVAEHLVKLGHRRIAYISNQLSYCANLDRLAGYRKALNAVGVALDPDLIVEGDGTMEGGLKAARKLLKLPQPPSAFFCFNDMTAIGVMSTLVQVDLQVPRDKSVAGFDDLELARYCNPPLTTVRQSIYRLGQCAIQTLLGLIQGRDDLGPITLPCKLVVRETTGPAPA